MKLYQHNLIYLVRGKVTELIKIGQTKVDIEQRVKELQIGSPDILEVIAVTFEPHTSENELHNKFSEYRKHGEWFLPSEDILEYVKQHCFKNISLAYSAYNEINSGRLSYEEAVSMKDDVLIKLCRESPKNEIHGYTI